MILKIGKDAPWLCDITAKRGFRGDIGFFFAVMDKLRTTPMFWWFEGLNLEVDFEQNKLVLRFGFQDPQVTEIPLSALVELDRERFGEQYMRPYAIQIALSWELPKTAELLQAGCKEFSPLRDVVAEDVSDSCRFNPYDAAGALQNLINTARESPWEEEYG